MSFNNVYWNISNLSLSSQLPSHTHTLQVKISTSREWKALVKFPWWKNWDQGPRFPTLELVLFTISTSFLLGIASLLCLLWLPLPDGSFYKAFLLVTYSLIPPSRYPYQFLNRFSLTILFVFCTATLCLWNSFLLIKKLGIFSRSDQQSQENVFKLILYIKWYEQAVHSLVTFSVPVWEKYCRSLGNWLTCYLICILCFSFKDTEILICTHLGNEYVGNIMPKILNTGLNLLEIHWSKFQVVI